MTPFESCIAALREHGSKEALFKVLEKALARENTKTPGMPRGFSLARAMCATPLADRAQHEPGDRGQADDRDERELAEHGGGGLHAFDQIPLFVVVGHEGGALHGQHGEVCGPRVAILLGMEVEHLHRRQDRGASKERSSAVR